VDDDRSHALPFLGNRRRSDIGDGAPVARPTAPRHPKRTPGHASRIHKCHAAADPNVDFVRSGQLDILPEALDAGKIKNVGESYTGNWNPSVAQTNMEQSLTASSERFPGYRPRMLDSTVRRWVCIAARAASGSLWNRASTKTWCSRQ
jgi:hypothetical protein